jgi:hypothetical protein
MPFARGDMRDHIVSHKNDHGASYGRYAVLQWWSRLKISFCEIFGVAQFSTFATLSPEKQTFSESVGMSQRCHNRKSKDPGSSRRSTLLNFILPHPTVGSGSRERSGCGAPACRHSGRRRSRLEPVYSRG